MKDYLPIIATSVLLFGLMLSYFGTMAISSEQAYKIIFEKAKVEANYSRVVSNK